jgi:hypothetical protein
MLPLSGKTVAFLVANEGVDPSLATDLANAGATCTPSRTRIDRNLITARSDADVEEFTRLPVEALSAGTPA